MTVLQPALRQVDTRPPCILAGLGLLLGLAGCGTGASYDPGEPEAPMDDSIASNTCPGPDDPVQPDSEPPGIESLLIGRWRHCAGPRIIDSSTVGIELLPDHSFFRLVMGAHGELVRTTGFGNQGTWGTTQWIPTSGWFDLEFEPYDGYNSFPVEERDRHTITIVDLPESSIYAREL